MIIAQSESSGLTDSIGWIAAGVIVVVFLAVGLGDLLRLNLKRVWAISSVCFRESIRRRVLWVTPLAMLGIIAVSQLSHPADEQDAIRQTTKYCLFASGIVVVIATLILACTSLPKEIENRVIYTIVTKPATRLEIVLGKSLGFSRTAGAMILVMGIFSYVYLQLNAIQLNAAIRARLANMPPADIRRDTLQHYLNEGLLEARSYTRPAPGAWGVAPGFEIFAKTPQPGDKYKWVTGSKEQNVLAPFELPPEIFDHPETHLIFNIELATEQNRALNKQEMESEPPDPTQSTATTRGAVRRPGSPAIEVSLLNDGGFTMVAPADVMDRIHTKDTKTREPDPFNNGSGIKLEPQGGNGVKHAVVVVMSKMMTQRVAALSPDAQGHRRIFLLVNGLTPATLYGFGPNAVTLFAELADASGKLVQVPIKAVGADGKPLEPNFRGRLSASRNQQLRGDSNAAEAPVAIFEFRGDHLEKGADSVPFELRSKVELNGAEATESDNGTRVDVVAHNLKTGQFGKTITVTVDSDHPTFFRLPRAEVEGGEFDVILKARTDGHYVGLRTGSVAVASSAQSFGFNLVKSLLILWLLSILVVIISVFCSTFVSWPIAVVLSVVLLLGRWCVVQLGDPSTPQQMATDIFGPNANPITYKVFGDAMGTLNKLLAVTSKVLPDLDQFRVTEDIEKGVSISPRSIADPLIVLGTFGVPVMILGYLFLRKKEVAP